MPSEEELRKARSEERADGWGFVDGMKEEDWLSKDCLVPDPAKEVTRLESGQILYHHTKQECVGNCCLHGTSSHASCKMPRSWRCDRSIIEHTCPHGIGHPCAAGVAHALMKPECEGLVFDLSSTHACDGCCNTIDELAASATVEQVDDRSDKFAGLEYSALRLDNDTEMIADWVMRIEDEMYQMDRRITRNTWLSLFTIFAVGVAIFLK